jgi:hypothetical protein
VIIEGFDDRASAFIMRTLAEGGVFAKELLKGPLILSEIISFVGAPPSDDRRYEFAKGEVRKGSSPTDELAELVQREMSSLRGGLMIVEDREAELGSRFLEGLPYVHYEGNILLTLRLRDVKKQDVEILLRSGTRYPLIMAISSDDNLELQAAIDLDRLRSCADELLCSQLALTMRSPT